MAKKKSAKKAASKSTAVKSKTVKSKNAAAKKSSAKAAPKSAGSADRSARKEPYSVERIDKVVDRMREQAARLSQLMRAMSDGKVDEIVVDGHAMLLRGLNQIDNFADNASRSLREAKADGKTR
jgi:hypothetical protein